VNSKLRAFVFGGLVGVIALVIDRVARIVHPAIHALLVPGSFITLPYQGESPWTTGILVGLLEFAFNFAIYGLAGVAIAAITSSRRRNG
jgi:hypothetical protein